MESNLRTRVLVRALRELRERARLTQQEAGARLHFDNRKMSRIERGQVPSFHELHAMLDVYGVPVNDWSHYDTMWHQAKEKGWWRAYGIADRGYVDLENEAGSVREFQLGFVPGLLQTPDYSRAIATVASQQNHNVETTVEVRMRRQRRLTSEHPLALHAIIAEPVLSADLPCMRDQLAHIVMLAELENVTIQILPARATHVGLFGSFIVLGFPEDPDIAHVEHVAGAVQIEKTEEVRRCSVAFDKLADQALGHERSVALVDRMASEL